MSNRFAESKSEGILKHFGMAFGLAVICYLAFYSCDGHLRSRKGSWELTFKSEPDGTPNLVINQHVLGITNVTIRLEGERADQKPETLVFTGPGDKTPFGDIIFFDTTYLPGTVTLDLFGHEVEMMGRTLILNFKEHPWQSGEVVTLRPEAKWKTVASTNQVNQIP